MTLELYTRNKSLTRKLPLHIVSIGRWNNFRNIAIWGGGTGGFSSGTWGTGNQALYIPVNLPARFTIARFFLCNGTAVAGNVDIGLYDANGNRLINTGATAQAGTSQVQYIDVTNQAFPAGSYWLALALSSGSGRVFSANLPSNTWPPLGGGVNENLAGLPLPTTMTPATRTLQQVACFGFTQSETL